MEDRPTLSSPPMVDIKGGNKVDKWTFKPGPATSANAPRAWALKALEKYAKQFHQTSKHLDSLNCKAASHVERRSQQGRMLTSKGFAQVSEECVEVLLLFSHC